MAVVESFDDALVILCVVRAAFQVTILGTPRVVFPGEKLFLLFCTTGVLSAVLADVPFTATLVPATFLSFKAFLLGWSAAQFAFKRSDIRAACKFGGYVVTFIIAASLFNLIAPGSWAKVMSVNGSSIDRYGLPSLLGPFIHPFDLAFALSMSGIAILAYRKYFRRSRLSFVLLIGSFMGTILSFRRKDLLGLGGATMLLAARLRFYWLLTIGIPLVALIVVFGWDEITREAAGLFNAYLSPESGEARTVLTLGSITMAQQYFPLGAGFGRYGSRTAGVQYSPEYYNLGFPSVYGLDPGGSFLTDTSWPAILGETGIIGTLSFAIGLSLMLRAANTWSRMIKIPEIAWLGTTAIGWIVLTIFQSTGSAVFTSPPMFAFLFTLIGVGASLHAVHTNSTPGNVPFIAHSKTQG